MTIHAVRHNRTPGRQIVEPLPDRFRRKMRGADDQLIIGAEGLRPANVKQERRSCSPDARVEIVARDWRGHGAHCILLPYCMSTTFGLLPLSAKYFVEIVEHLCSARDPLRIVGRRQCDAVDQGTNADSLLAAELAVPQIDFVNNPGNRAKTRLVQR